ncbi:MAG TPA: TetR/AcrR family transcriptional regulator [Chryseolinea sp.]|nr:TetR/AcrR family transcriptional regulator [Chryseolinea sp.]
MSAGRPKDFDEAAVLDKAIELFWKKGYEATSLEQLLAAMGMGKGSMYHNFGNKREVFKLALNRFNQKFVGWLDEEVTKAKDPIAFIKDYFRGIPRQGADDHKKGCFLGNTVAELACIDPGLEKLAAEHLERMEDIFYTHVKNAQQRGKLKSKEDARLLARHLINLWNGLNITRRMYSSPKELVPLVEFQLKMIQ